MLEVFEITPSDITPRELKSKFPFVSDGYGRSSLFDWHSFSPSLPTRKGLTEIWGPNPKGKAEMDA